MEKYDYRTHIIEDVKNYIKDHPENWPDPKKVDDIEEYWCDLIFDTIEVTGNGDEWYDTEEACREYLKGNRDLVIEAICEHYDHDDILYIIDYWYDGTLARYLDCVIRTYMLSGCVYEALEELNKET